MTLLTLAMPPPLTLAVIFYMTLLTLAMPPSQTLAKTFVSKKKPHPQKKQKEKKKNYKKNKKKSLFDRLFLKAT